MLHCRSRSGAIRTSDSKSGIKPLLVVSGVLHFLDCRNSKIFMLTAAFVSVIHHMMHNM
jgi:hypothetical protein